MSLEKRLRQQRKRRTNRVRNKFVSRGVRLRVSVFRSAKQIYAQIIDDSTHKTLACFSSLKLKDAKGDKSTIAKQVGLELAKIAKDKLVDKQLANGIIPLFFDRGSYRFHGRVRALADGLREGGLKL